MVEEMVKLRQMLNEHHIKWVDKSDMQIDRTHFYYRGFHWSVVNGYGTYGEDEGLLELMSNAVNGGEPIGYLTADEVMKMVLTKRKE
jgi:hypothetical protein